MVPVLGCLATAVALVAGCSFAGGLSTAPTVSKDALQTEIATRLTKAGEHPLIGEVGQTAHCEVVLSPTNSFAAGRTVEVYKLDGLMMNFDLQPI